MDSDQGSDGDISENERPLNHLDTTNDPQFIQSSFDAYFHQASSRSRTSANVFSSRVLPLTQDEYNSAITAYKARSPSQPQTRWTGPHDTRTAFRRYAHELEQGFNLLFYGFGSKRVVLNTFATECLATRGHVVVVVDGFHPNTYSPQSSVFPA
jgi:origin recognition complex subunit 2